MRGWIRYSGYLLVVALIAVVLSGCGGKEEALPANESPEVIVPPSPVTVTMFNHFNGLSQERLERFVLAPLERHLPHITFEVISDQNGSRIEDLVSSGNFPDLYYGSNVQFPAYLNLALQQDMNDLVRSHGVDLNRFDPAFINGIKTFDSSGKLFALPFSANLGVLIYNKDIFDKFGVDYPVDGMSWDEVADLGRRLTRPFEGVSYIGFDPGSATDMMQGLSLPYVDTRTKTVLVDHDNWRRVFEIFRKVYTVPGHVNNGRFDYGVDGFAKDQVVAMRPIWALQILNHQNDLQHVNWDIVALPNFEDQLGQGREIDIHLLSVSTVSKNKDAAMQVLKLITSDEVQRAMSESGTPTVLQNPDIINAYATKVSEFVGKNVQAVFKTTPRVPHVITIYDATVRGQINAARREIAIENKDTNTIIREIEEKANQALATLK